MNTTYLHITDNSSYDDATQEQLDALRPIANYTIRELIQDNKNLLIFPNSLDLYGDKIGDEIICETKTHGNKNILSTGNILGFVGSGDMRLKISSRFDKDSANDYFVLYMLSRVLSLNVFDWKFGTEDEDILDFLIHLFPYYLNEALRCGLYKEYQSFEYNDSNIRGCIDIKRHINLNIPFTGKVAYTTREHTFDNNLTELIRHTIEYIKTKPMGMTLLNINRTTQENVSLIIQSTPTYNKNNRQAIIGNNLRPKVHPYYSTYLPLQQLCLRILRHENIRYGNTSDEVFGILFDGAWLWEEYLATILCPQFIHPKNRQYEGSLYMFEKNANYSNRRIYPDFYKDTFVLDAKYKRKIDMADEHQVTSYMHVMSKQHGGFISPADSCSVSVRTLRGIGGDIAEIKMAIPQNQMDWNSFRDEIYKFEQQTLSNITLLT